MYIFIGTTNATTEDQQPDLDEVEEESNEYIQPSSRLKQKEEEAIGRGIVGRTTWRGYFPLQQK